MTNAQKRELFKKRDERAQEESANKEINSSTATQPASKSVKSAPPAIIAATTTAPVATLSENNSIVATTPTLQSLFATRNVSMNASTVYTDTDGTKYSICCLNAN